jgi:hypothetical protein
LDILKKEDLKELIKKRNETCVSIYIPTHIKGAEREQDPIRLKNNLKKAELLLKERKCKDDEIDLILKPARRLLDDLKFWQHQSNGLALFLTKNENYIYRLPYEFEEMTVVYPGFNIKQLIPVLSGDENFYILSLDLKRTSLYKATRFTIHEVELHNTPLSLEEAMKYDDAEKSLQFHSGTSSVTAESGGRTGRAAIFHGHGTGVDEAKQKKDILEFFHLLERSVLKVINNSNDPLVLLGVEYLIPIYRETNSYAYTKNESITINPQDLQEKEIHQRAWKIIKNDLSDKFDDAVNQYNEYSTAGLATSDLNVILEAVYSNRVKYLFVNIDEQQWGNFNVDTLEMRIDDSPENGNIDLLDLAALQTIIHNGVVYSVKSDLMPAGAKAAAVFRF